MTLPLSLQLRSILVSHWLTLLHRVESSMSALSEGRRGSLSQMWPQTTCHPWRQPSSGHWRQSQGIKFEMPSGMGGVNGTVKYSVVDSPGVPPLTPVSLLKQVGAVIDLNSNTMDLKKIETTTTLRTLPSGHVAHRLTEFALVVGKLQHWNRLVCFK